MLKKVLVALTPSWKTIRLIGETKLLTKASYMSLLFVPLIVVVWDGIMVAKVKWNTSGDKQVVRLIEVVNNQAQKARDKLDGFNIELEEFESKDLEFLKRTNESLRIAENNLLKLDQKIKNRSNDPYPFPELWVKVFLCAIFVGVGHLIYEIRCPDEIQKFSLDEYTNNKKSLFSQFGTNSDLKKAETKLRKDDTDLFVEGTAETIKTIESIKRVAIPKKKERVGKMNFSDLYAMKDYVVHLESKSQADERILDIINQRMKKIQVEDIELVNLNTIGKAAEIDYRLMSKQSAPFIYVAGAFYLVGIYLLLIIVASQVHSVLDAGGQLFWEYFKF